MTFFEESGENAAGAKNQGAAFFLTIMNLKRFGLQLKGRVQICTILVGFLLDNRENSGYMYQDDHPPGFPSQCLSASAPVT